MIFLRYSWDHIKIEDYSNYLTHFEFQLPFAITHMGNWIEGPGYYNIRQNPDDYYLLYTVSGCGAVTYRQNTVMLQPGQICLIDGAETHSYKTEGQEPWHSLWFHFTGQGMKSYFDLINPADSFNIINLSDRGIPNYYYEAFKKSLSLGDLDKALKNCVLIVEFLNVLVKDSSEENDAANTGPVGAINISDIKNYIEDKVHTVITVSGLGNVFHIPVRKLDQLFMRHENMSVAEYIQKRYSIYRGYDRISIDNQDWLIKSIEFINENYTNDIKIKDIIKDCHVSKTIFIRKFKQYTSMSPLEYLIKLRLEHALMLLQNTDKKISAIAMESGFPSASNFTARFKEWTGVLPGVYRRNKLV